MVTLSVSICATMSSVFTADPGVLRIAATVPSLIESPVGRGLAGGVERGTRWSVREAAQLILAVCTRTRRKKSAQGSKARPARGRRLPGIAQGAEEDAPMEGTTISTAGPAASADGADGAAAAGLAAAAGAPPAPSSATGCPGFTTSPAAICGAERIECCIHARADDS